VKLAVKTAGLFATGSLSLVMLTAYFTSQQSWKALELGLPAALAAGFIGYQIGNIMANPKGPTPARNKHKKQAAGHGAPMPTEPEQPLITGEETYLADLEEVPPA
jgi:hypothetical protein